MQISGLTHADPVAGEACVIWCVAIDRAIREGRLDGVSDGIALLPDARRQFWSERLDEAERNPPGSFSPNGYVVTALQAAWAAIRQTAVPAEQSGRHLVDALGAAVRIGDDADTVAAIAGALLGARWGATAVPLEWKSKLHGWPGYQVADLVRLAILTVRGGHDDDAGWPSRTSLLAWYESGYRLSGVATALPDDPEVWVGDVACLTGLPEGTSVVVSLCRVGRQDVPAGIEHPPGLAHGPCSSWREPQPGLDSLRPGRPDVPLACRGPAGVRPLRQSRESHPGRGGRLPGPAPRDQRSGRSWACD